MVSLPSPRLRALFLRSGAVAVAVAELRFVALSRRVARAPWSARAAARASLAWDEVLVLRGWASVARSDG